MTSRWWHEPAYKMAVRGELTKTAIAAQLGVPRTTVSDYLLKRFSEEVKPSDGPKILVLDIETAPIRAAVWRIFKENVGLSQIEKDWYVISWAAKWIGDDEVFYEDKSESYSDEDDFELLQGIWDLLDQADIIITQNGKRFDKKKLNARFIFHGMKPPSMYRHIDTLEIAKKNFGFTSNKLEYMTNLLCTVYKKLDHKKFPGYSLWEHCLKGDPEAWQEMQDYNIHDVLSLEELYMKMRPWDNSHPNINLYYEDLEIRCRCSSTNLDHNGYWYTNLSKFDKFRCKDCGAEVRGRVNLLPKEKRETLRGNIIA